jgi:hypothetical protein
MDEEPEDLDTMIRFQSMHWAESIMDALDAQWTTDQLIANAAQITHFITSGEGVAVTCDDKLRKTVRGQ